MALSSLSFLPSVAAPTWGAGARRRPSRGQTAEQKPRVLDPALTPSQRRRVCGVTFLALSRHPVSNEVRRDARRLRPWWVGTKA